MAIVKLDEIYKVDNKGKTRVWWCEIDDDRIRNVSGIKDGELIYSGWKQMKAKNEGRSNATTPQQQAVLEAQALYDKKLAQGGYHRQIESAGEKTYIEPMLAAKYADVNLMFPVYTQPKLDGHRCIATKDGLFTRKGKKYHSVPHIEFALEPLFEKDPDLILDGELYNHDLRDNFDEIASCVRKSKPTAEDLEQALQIQYHVYDLVTSDVMFRQRSDLLHDLLQELNNKYIVDVPTAVCNNQEQLDELYGEMLAAGYEGQMIRLNTEYQNKRTKDLIKRKEFLTEEFPVHKVVEGQGNWAGYAKAVILWVDGVPEKDLPRAGIRGNREFAKQLLDNAANYIGKSATIRFPNKTPSGVPRFPVAIDFAREDHE